MMELSPGEDKLLLTSITTSFFLSDVSIISHFYFFLSDVSIISHFYFFLSDVSIDVSTLIADLLP